MAWGCKWFQPKVICASSRSLEGKYASFMSCLYLSYGETLEDTTIHKKYLWPEDLSRDWPMVIGASSRSLWKSCMIPL